MGSHIEVATVFDRLRWFRAFFPIAGSSKQCVRADVGVIAVAVDVMWHAPRCIDIDRDRFISSLLHLAVPQPKQCDKSTDGYVLSLLLLLFCVQMPDLRISEYE